jgi:tRNA modification GTPase
MIHADTIAAPATALGEAGIAVIRVSGPDAVAATAALLDRPARDRRVVVTHVRDPRTGDVVDEALVLLMRAPRSFTREDVVELHLHGGRMVVERTLALLYARGVRAAAPGEFTLRAFLNGRIDLSQAEAVLDVIQARTDAAQRVATAGLLGRIGDRVRAIRAGLLETLAYLVARIDFPDEDVPEEPVTPRIAGAISAVTGLVAGARSGALYRDGARVALIGAPNAGKSSLLNRLLREERAIVTPVAGTTRDTVEEVTDIGGIPVVLVDTAGFSDAPDAIEAIGIERARVAAARADAILLVLDAAGPAPALLADLVEVAGTRPALVALNKCDLPRRLPAEAVPAAFPAVDVSAMRGDGLERLERRLIETLGAGVWPGAGELLIANPRHAAALRRARDQLEIARAAAESRLPEDFVGIDLRAAIDTLGQITGETAGEDLLDTIFSRFCIGK